MSFSAVGNVFDIEAFEKHLDSLPSLAWAKGVCVHHTAYPDLSMRPKGWTIQHMRNLADYYGSKLKWSAGPHLFTDEDQIFGLSPLTARGVHAVSFNASYIGIEALGNYDSEDPFSGRGAEVWNTTAHCIALLLKKLGLPANARTILFHRDDPKTTKSCPGKRIGKDWLVAKVEAIMADDRADKESPAEPDDLDPANSNTAKARELLKQAMDLLG